MLDPRLASLLVFLSLSACGQRERPTVAKATEASSETNSTLAPSVVAAPVAVVSPKGSAPAAVPSHVTAIAAPIVVKGGASPKIDANVTATAGNVTAPMGGHGGHIPPIDCPLAKAGVDPSGLKPFKEVDKYIAFLERPDRAQWQRPDAIVEALGLRGNETVADIGAGSGYFSFRFAAALPEGRVRAIDVEPEMVRHIHHKAMTSGVDNIEAVLTSPDDPQVSGAEDLVFICDVLHHVPNRSVWIKGLFDAMRPGSRLAIVEFKEGELPHGPPAGLKIPRAKLIALASGAGFVLTEDKAELLPYQHMLVFRRP